MEKVSENPGQRLIDEIEAAFGVNLSSQIEGLLPAREPGHFNMALEKIQTFLRDAGLELNPAQRIALSRILADYFR